MSARKLVCQPLPTGTTCFCYRNNILPISSIGNFFSFSFLYLIWPVLCVTIPLRSSGKIHFPDFSIVHFLLVPLCSITTYWSPLVNSMTSSAAANFIFFNIICLLLALCHNTLHVILYSIPPDHLRHMTEYTFH